MSFRPRPFTVVAAAAALVALPAAARPAHHRGHHHAHAARGYAAPAYGTAASPYPPQATGGYYGSPGWEAAVNARRTAEAYREPGVTLELAPDAKQTATGGPAGGIPGFSGQ